MKWSFPHFDYKGMMCSTAAFKGHVALTFWKAKLLAERGLTSIDRSAMGQFGRITSISDLPPEQTLVRLVKAAAALNDEGLGVARPKRAARPPVRPPAFFMAALRRNRAALATFRAFPPSHRREYVEWVTEAKARETRDRRLAQAIEWMAAGRSRNWRYAR